jgi:hypothetical protein
VSLPGTSQKKSPVGRQSTKKSDSDSSSSSSFLVSTAEVVVEVYRLKSTAGSESKSTRQVIDLLRSRYKTTSEVSIDKLVRETVLPEDVSKTDSDNSISGTLCVSRYVYRKLGLKYKKYTQYEVRLLVMDTLKGIQQKDAGCINLGLSKQSISNYL